MKVIVTSANPVKMNATKEAFERMLPNETCEIVSFPVPSNVSEQPMTDSETYAGAMNRVENALKEVPDADFWVGIEGGVEKKGVEIETFAWIIIRDKDGMIGRGRSATLFLPRAVAEKIDEGLELGQATDAVFHETNSKQNMGTIGILTNGLIDRTKYYVDPAIIALIPFVNPELYKSD